MGQQKPSSEFWVVGDKQLCDGWLYRMSSVDKLVERRCLLWEDETRSYLLRFAPSGLSRLSGVIFISWFGEPISTQQIAFLSLASLYTPDVYVVLCNMNETSPYRRDREESAAREALSAIGFSGDEALILLEPGLFPSEETAARLWEEVSQKAPLRQPGRCFEGREMAASRLRELIRPALFLAPIQNSTQPKAISTQLGGSPYLEQGEEWPVCPSCRSNKLFLMQVNAAQDLLPRIDGAGLYAIYSCTEAGQHQGALPLTVRHYKTPSLEKQRRDGLGGSLDLCSLEKVPGALLPDIRDVLDGISPDVMPLRVVLQEMGADDPNLELATLYRELCQEAGVFAVEFSFDLPPSLQIGGYSASQQYWYEPNLMGCCERCGRLLKTLVNLHWVAGVGFPWRYNALQFFLCGCDPDKVYTRVLYGDEPDE